MIFNGRGSSAVYSAPMADDGIRIVDLGDIDLSDYLDIIVDESQNYVLFDAKIGVFRFQDVDDADDSDMLKLTNSDAAGSLLQKTSQITDGNIWEIESSGTISGATATADINYLALDVDAIVLNDAATNAITLQGMEVDFNGATLTAVGLSTLRGLNIELPIITGFNDASGIRVATNTNDLVVDIVNDSHNGLAISGDNITATDWLKIVPSGTMNADNHIQFAKIDLGSYTINDGGAGSPSIVGLEVAGTNITTTAVGTTGYDGIYIHTPTTGAFSTEVGLNIDANKGDVDMGCVGLDVGRYHNADFSADRSVSTYTARITQSVLNSTTGDFDIDQPANSGALYLGLLHTAASTVGAKTDPDTFAATALAIDVDAVTNTDANTKLDAYPRAIDIDYTFTETLGTLRMAATDICRIAATIPDGLSSAGAFQFDMMEFNADNVTLNDANITFKMLNLDASGLTNTNSAALEGVCITMDAATRTALTTNAEIVAGNYTAEDYMHFELWEPDNETNVTIVQVYDSDFDEIILQITATGAGSTDVWCQYRMPTDFKAFANSSDDLVVRSEQDVDSGDGADCTITVSVLDDAGTDIDDDSINADVIATEAGGIGNIYTADCAIDSSGALVAGDHLMVKISIGAMDNTDVVKLAVPKIRYKRSG